MAHSEHQAHDTHQHGPGCGHEEVRHGDHADYVHDGHRHAPHNGHWDEHGMSVADAATYGSSDALGVSRDDSGAAASSWSAGPEDRPETPDDVGGS